MAADLVRPLGANGTIRRLTLLMTRASAPTSSRMFIPSSGGDRRRDRAAPREPFTPPKAVSNSMRTGTMRSPAITRAYQILPVGGVLVVVPICLYVLAGDFTDLRRTGEALVLVRGQYF